MINGALYSSYSGDYGTPPEIFEPIEHELQLNFDAAASVGMHLLPEYATIGGTYRQHYTTPNKVSNDDGLTIPWRDRRVWCNPPYGREVWLWARKAAQETMVRNGCPVAALLLPARTDTDWFHRWVAPYAEVYFLMARVKFWGHDWKSGNEDGDYMTCGHTTHDPIHPLSASAPFPSIVAVYSPKISAGPTTVLARRWDPRTGTFPPPTVSSIVV